VVNAGSSSLKLRVLGGPGAESDEVTDGADLPAVGGSDGDTDAKAIEAAVKSFGPVDAAGHRIVHGGTLYAAPVLVTSEVRRRLESLTDLAPLHQPKSLAALDAVSSVLPDTPAVACFDTAFHATIPEAAATYALPAEWRTRWTLRRFGFHGLSHSYVSRRAADLAGAGAATATAAGTGAGPAQSLAGTPGQLRVVTCHLGAGASLAAVQGGRSVDTTMGFTPLDGLVMATRSGSVDPGLVLWLEEHAHMPSRELAATLENRSGLAGLAGTGDMREVLSRAAAGDARAVLGRDVYLHRLRGSIASMATAMGGLDVLVFTGGVGENSPEIRSRAAAGLAFLGVAVDERRNNLDKEARADDWEITVPEASVRTFVIAAREDKQIAAEVRSVLG
jgi:acetate kinase